MKSKLVVLCMFFFVSDDFVHTHGSPTLTETTAEALPFHAVVRGKMICNGILITDQYVITPAYCVYGSTEATVHLGFHGYPHYMAQHPEPNTQILPSSKIIIHEDFTKLNNHHYLNNIALIKLSKPATLSAKVMPGKLISRQEYHLLEGKFAEVGGWMVGKDENKKIATVQIRNQDTCSYLFGDQLLKSQEFCVKWFTKTRLNLVGNSVRIDNKIIGYQTNTPHCTKASSGCTQNDMVLNIIPFLDWMSHNMDVPIEEFTSKSHDCCDNHDSKDSKELEHLVMKMNDTLYEEILNFRKYDVSIADLNRKIEDILATLKTTKNEQNNFALSLNEQIAAIATQINNNKVQVEQNILNLQEQLSGMRTEISSGSSAQQSFNDLEAKFIGLNNTLQLKVSEQSDKFEEKFQELINKSKNNEIEEQLLRQKIELESLKMLIDEGKNVLDQKFSHIDDSFKSILSEQHEVQIQLVKNEGEFKIHITHEKECLAKLQKKLDETAKCVEENAYESKLKIDQIEKVFGEQRNDLDEHIIKEFNQLHTLKTEIQSINVTVHRILGFIYDDPSST